jgi:hypothetical protein
MEVYDAEVLSLELDKLNVLKPRKTDDSLFGKITYDDGQLNMHIHNSQVIKHKKVKHLSKCYTVLFLKVPKNICKKIVDFDSVCIEQVKTNLGGWFTKALDENVIEEYYTSSIIVSKNDGFILKLKLQGDDDILDNARYDIIIALKGLRFYKQRFIPEWEIVNIKPVEDDFLNSLESDDDPWQEELIEDEVIPEPTNEELQIISDTLIEKIHKYLRQYSSDINSLQEKTSLLETLLTKLTENKHDVSVLDEISDQVEKLYSAE